MPDKTIQIEDEGTVWRFERSFLQSNWKCIWNEGCLGILPEAKADGRGCCSIGAELDGPDEAMLIAALAATLEPVQFQHHEQAAVEGVFKDDSRTATRVVDGACIFLNRPDFAGGSGCALHLAALQHDESPLDWKPSVCWQLPIKVDYEALDDDTETAVVRRWSRADWGTEGRTMAWCCTEGERAYVGEEPVIDSLREEITALAGERVYVELRRRVVT